MRQIFEEKDKANKRLFALEEDIKAMCKAYVKEHGDRLAREMGYTFCKGFSECIESDRFNKIPEGHVKLELWVYDVNPMPRYRYGTLGNSTNASVYVKIEELLPYAPKREESDLTEDDVRKVMALFDESSDYYNKKIEEGREESVKNGYPLGPSKLAQGLWNGSIDARELAIKYILDKLGIKKEEQ